MVMLQPEFVHGVVRRTVVLGLASALVLFWAMSAQVAIAVVVGTLVSAVNLLALTWSIKKVLQQVVEGSVAAVWPFLIVAKMLGLVAAIWVLLTVAKLNAVGFVFGFSAFLPAIFWQLWVVGPEGAVGPDGVAGPDGEELPEEE